ncbi:SGNH/GDSL hydrolase family protein [Fulvivirga sedimenti]|uniref:SGNH/GDSL hydrolase family protein n=1 Tax=Fulvivirga sedimenti TaxID=2879465 RepID=A0A9X1HRT9_9BACT|nr:SGNH/GDSL hydrolase family protein [Fulvivirga sedimenti]MCA6074868.1 SGNH/GDSL hydrolase family protein [Fulvivirga sedimenti]MCA6076045.1 SGNH/GDSL hydrolase family protein [Fulvivirga sedimenti]MCA6077173.1 SGNH/GDSL hydrolase family protein [Fulvivirga sedimenti]
MNNQSEQKEMRQFLALGDSYTIGESVGEDDRWPVQLAEEINSLADSAFAAPVIIARTGWRTDELISAIGDRKPTDDFDLVSLLIGVNNQYQQRPVEDYRKEFRDLVEIAIQKARGNPDRVLVVSIPDYGYTPFGAANKEKISAELDNYNEINRSIAQEYDVIYVSITDISRSTDASLVADDNLHPSARQYELWVERILASERFAAEFLND